MRRYIIIITAVLLIFLLLTSPLRQIYAPIKFRGLIKQYARKYELDWLLISAIVFNESRFKYQAVSDKGARGLMQVMPDTGSEIAGKMGLRDWNPDMLFNPSMNLDMGCYYFKKLLTEFNNDIALALAAYNAGKGCVYRLSSVDNRGLSYPSGDSLTYNDIDKYLYPQTRIYVTKVNNTYKLLKLFDKIWRL